VSVYVIAEIEVTDPDGYAKYAPLANESVLRHGGRFVVRGGPSEIIEGEWAGRMVILEFDSHDAAQAWYHSDDYQAALPIRLKSSRGRMIAVEGADV
jgi:uncharacterized protein (DUF1330 family)